jgi:cephalosporin hydroxylase
MPDREVDDFHRLYYEAGLVGGTWQATTWLGVPLLKCPLDLWVYQELIHDQRPDLIVETGTWRGGSALFLASVCDLVGHGQVVSIDINAVLPLPEHERVRFIAGSSVDPAVVSQVERLAAGLERVLVILDSKHTCDHVLEELRAYSGLVPVDGYLIVEDTNLNGRPVWPDYGAGPGEAVDAFLAEYPDFVVDRAPEKHYLTFCPGGFLRRSASAAAPDPPA